MATNPHVPNAPLVPLPATFILLPLEVRHMIYCYLVLEVDIHVAANSSPIAPRYRRVYSGPLVNLADSNTFLRHEVLSLRDTYDVVARTGVNVDMPALINSISTAQFHNIVDLEMMLFMGYDQLPLHVIRYAPARFGDHLKKLRRLKFVLMFSHAPLMRYFRFMDIICDQILAHHPILSSAQRGFAVATGTTQFTIT